MTTGPDRRILQPQPGHDLLKPGGGRGRGGRAAGLPAAATPAAACRPPRCPNCGRWRRRSACSRRRPAGRRSALRRRGCRMEVGPPEKQSGERRPGTGTVPGNSRSHLQRQLRADLVLPVPDPAGQSRFLGVALAVHHQLLLNAPQRTSGGPGRSGGPGLTSHLPHAASPALRMSGCPAEPLLEDKNTTLMTSCPPKLT